ncbi:MAG: hypothetical protein ACI4LM_02320 [Anaerovoracaceae bacterium]
MFRPGPVEPGMVRLNKKGTEMVEASLVLPLLILTIASMIMLLVFFSAL